jgi:hypothetical protein
MINVEDRHDSDEEDKRKLATPDFGFQLVPSLFAPPAFFHAPSEFIVSNATAMGHLHPKNRASHLRIHHCLNLSATQRHNRLGLIRHLKNPKYFSHSPRSRNVYVTKFDFRAFFNFGLIIETIHPSKSLNTHKKGHSE